MALDNAIKKNLNKFWTLAVLPIKNSLQALTTSVSNIISSVSLIEILIGTVDNFVVRSQANRYIENEYVKHADNQNHMKVWRCKANGWHGEWNEEGWIQTDLWNEIRSLRGMRGRVESVKVKVTKNRGEGVIAGSTVTVIFDAAAGRDDATLILDSNGEAEFGVTIGDKYWVRCDGITGYVTPNTRVYTASMTERVIEFEYKMLGSGLYVIDDNGYEWDIELWSVANNGHDKFLKLTNSTLNPGGLSHDNSIIIATNYEISAGMAWCIEYKDFTRNNNFTSSATAITDMNGYQNSLNIREEAVALNAAGKSYIDIYNDSHPDAPVTIDGYIPAFMYAYNHTVSFMGQQAHGYVMSAGQIQVLKDNLTDVNAALAKLAKPALPLNSGNRWTATEYSSSGAWALCNGSWYNFDKTYTYICVLAAYDLSDIL